MTDNQIIENIVKHDQLLSRMAESIKDLAETTKESNKKLELVVQSITKQELILEKLTNLEEKTKDSINRVHKRIDQIEDSIKYMKSRGENGGCSALKLAQANEKTINEKMNENIKSNQKRLDANDKHKSWIITLVLGAVVMAVLNLIFK